MPKPDLGIPERTPPRARGGCRCVSAMALLFFAVGGLVTLCVFAFLYLQQQEQTRAEFAPPIVFVDAPAPGESAPAGSFLSVHATVISQRSIARAELWRDGELVETLTSDLSQGASPFHANFDLLLTEGDHMLFVRGVDSANLIGQSLPIAVTGSPKPAPGKALAIVTVEQSQTLADIARDNGTDAGTLQKVNPGLGSGPLAPGTLVAVPTGPKEGELPSPPSPPTLPPSTGPSEVPIPPSPPLPPQSGGPIAIALPNLLPMAPISPPTAPSDLKAQLSDCQVFLTWNDNATNESGYKVWMAGLGLPPRLIATLEAGPATGPVWFQFQAPPPGFFSFWVEVYNFYSAQPSNIAWVYNGNLYCSSPLATQLQVELMDLTVQGGYDRVYCYTSFEGAPEVRLPTEAGTFVRITGGKGDLAIWDAASRIFLIPIPTDGVLSLEGECWGWLGKSLTKLGVFKDSTTIDQWNGAPRSLTGSPFTIRYSVKIAGEMFAQGRATYQDPTLPAPYNVREFVDGSPALSEHVLRWLRWEWNGDEKKINGFAVFLDGKPYKTIQGARERTTDVKLSIRCGKRVRWQVAAISGSVLSRLSAPYEYEQQPCPVFAEVTFEQVLLTSIEEDVRWPVFDTSICSDRNAFNEVYYEIWAVGAVPKIKYFYKPGREATMWVGPTYTKIKCGTYTFKYLAEGSKWKEIHNYDTPDTIVVPISPSTERLQFGAEFWDYDESPGDDDRIARFTKIIVMPYNQWVGYDSKFEFSRIDYGGADRLYVRVRGFQKSP